MASLCYFVIICVGYELVAVMNKMRTNSTKGYV